MKKKILIIEDDPDGRTAYNIRLAAHGYETFFAPDGLASISQAQTHRPDLIILDLGLPGGDGFGVMEKLRAIPHLGVIPIIVVSGRDPFANRERALQAGARAFLQKPVNNDRLLDLIEKYLGKSEKSAPSW
jgi:two-component system KDP operon response regulator KdpE